MKTHEWPWIGEKAIPPVPDNWRKRPRYARILRELRKIEANFPEEVQFAREHLEVWVKRIPAFYAQVSPPWHGAETIEEMEDCLRGGEDLEIYGDFISALLHECYSAIPLDPDPDMPSMEWVEQMEEQMERMERMNMARVERMEAMIEAWGNL